MMNGIKKYDYVIIGSGLFGAVFARLATDNKKRCLIIDKREHYGGNCYTSKKNGIDIHEYGPHIFHCNNEKIWKFVNQFSEFNNFIYKPKVINNGNLFSFPINLFTLYQLWGVKTPEEAINKINSVKISGDKSSLKGWIQGEVGEEIYRIFYENYSTKQWGKDPSQIPASVAKRVPIRFTYNDNYFNDKYQGIPINGYTSLFSNMLDGIDLDLKVDYFSNRDYIDSLGKKIVYTGPIDKFFDYKFDKLEWRSLRFEHEEVIGDFQGNAVINYTDLSPFTRICEHKHFVFSEEKKSIITKEYPSAFGDPYYPVRDSKNIEIYNKYKSIKPNKFIFGGRLADYMYYDMHQVIGSALNTVSKELPFALGAF